MTDDITPEITLPAPMALIPWTDPSLLEIPRPPHIYFLQTPADGNYMFKRTLFGDTVVPFKDQIPGYTPPVVQHLKADQIGGLTWKNDVKFPGFIVAQCVAWFTRIYDKHHTEAAVVIA